MAAAYLSKSDFMAGMACPKRLWLNKNHPELASPKTDDDLARMEAGRQIGDLARLLHPEGVFPARGQNNEENAENTRRLMEAGAPCIFEATFIDGQRLARVDILRRVGDAWTLDEVKMSTVDDPKVLYKEGKVHEVEFQAEVLAACNVEVAEKSLVLIDGQYVYEGGELDLNRLFGRVPVDAECEKAKAVVELGSNELYIVLKDKSCPVVETNKKKCKGCGYYSYCHKEQPEHCITLLPRLSGKKEMELRTLGYDSIDQIPDDFDLPPTLKRVRDAVANDKPYISENLPADLQRITFPAAFVDFESCASAIPIFKGTRPYTQACFQWSMHLMESPTAQATHSEFLYDGPEDPREDFCRTLYDAVKDCGSFFHYAAFEKTQLNAMVAADIPYASQLAEIIATRGIDLKKMVADNVYVKEFKGSFSIKSVLPAFAPDMTYKNLPIANGTAASRAYIEMITAACTPSRREEIRSHLLAYCKQDTLAMVKVYEKLLSFAHPLPA